LRGHPQEAGGHLRIEHALGVAAERAAQERYVLASGVHHHLDLRVRQHSSKRVTLQRALERVDDLDLLVPRPVGDRELDQAEQRAVAALAYELCVERDPPRGAGTLGHLRQHACRSGLARARLGCRHRPILSDSARMRTAGVHATASPVP
jgi:hypothetical protein